MRTPPEPLSGTDLDRLADYREGLLNASDADEVRRLIESDTRWTEANELLGPALGALSDRLGEFAREPVEMPADVIASVEGELRAERPPISLDGARQRRRRWMTGPRLAAAAAALVVLAGIGVVAGKVLPGQSGSTASSATGSSAATGPADLYGAVVVTHSGTNYTADSLSRRMPGQITYNGEKVAPRDRSPAPLLQQPGPATGAGSSAAEPTGDVLGACLTQLSQRYGATAVAVDYGTFDGTPALIVTMTSPNLVVAVGTDCGSPGGGEQLGITR